MLFLWYNEGNANANGLRNRQAVLNTSEGIRSCLMLIVTQKSVLSVTSKNQSTNSISTPAKKTDTDAIVSNAALIMASVVIANQRLPVSSGVVNAIHYSPLLRNFSTGTPH